ncbi:hypothetical protein GIB67_001495 [Kingdonia uniflora]|uniref:DNA2/NAM7 helicase-like C-terminal domain-containing protein n=1 Tax=Kingdonia uniflora TaxID=39325 RepID=A0A7J7MNW8_9MAGN|nr:hypothetical protein GIB67_001495 [Kingdonia uniflora]
MNVGITRTRSSVLVVDSTSTLKQDKHWCNLVKNTEECQCIFKIRKPYASFFSDENMPTMKVVKKVEAMIEEVQSHLDVTENNTINYGNQEVGVDDGGNGGMDDD